ncbi:hypothetical protein PIB30_109619, partial [Stylosanthes scabra]|nr:hypothetical protein [Stylosanthes scabra]
PRLGVVKDGGSSLIPFPSEQRHSSLKFSDPVCCSLNKSISSTSAYYATISSSRTVRPYPIESVRLAAKHSSLLTTPRRDTNQHQPYQSLGARTKYRRDTDSRNAVATASTPRRGLSPLTTPRRGVNH